MGRIALVTPSLFPHDAVSEDVFIQEKEFQDLGFSVGKFSEMAPSEIKSTCMTYEQVKHLIKDPGNLLIYHHSVGWKGGGELLKTARCQVIIKYHNITPAKFFEPYDRSIASKINEGIQQTKLFATLNKIAWFLGDSQFNLRDFWERGVEKERTRVIAPYHRVKEFQDGVHQHSLPMDESRTHLLFVGRMAPNKGIPHLIHTLDAALESYGSSFQLHLVGEMFSNLKFQSELKSLIESRNLSQFVRFYGRTNHESLNELFSRCDLFIVMSEHEGFCVPIIEAQAKGLPVIALDRSAISETLGPNQICLKQPNYQEFAAAIHCLSHNIEQKDFIRQEGFKNIQRFDVSKTTLNYQAVFESLAFHP